MNASKKDALKSFSCFFLDNVLCSYRKSEKFGVMSRCFKCEHYRRFMRSMDEEDERTMDEIDKIRANPEAYLRGELG